MTETARIRWEPTQHGGFTGHVGTRAETGWLFQIWSAASVGGDWQLDSTLPGHFGQHSRADDPATLKADAEFLLSEFVSSLGAVFPEDEDEDDAIFDERPTGEAFEALYAPGRRVRFDHPDGGWDGDQQMAAALLTPGEVYTIAWSDIGFSKTRLGLAGVETRGQGFNSVLFEPVEDETAALAARED